jgi:hypothetical protein
MSHNLHEVHGNIPHMLTMEKASTAVGHHQNTESRHSSILGMPAPLGFTLHLLGLETMHLLIMMEEQSIR